MKTKFLFPHAYKKFGWIIFIVGIVILLIDFSLGLVEPQWLNFKVFAIVGNTFSKDRSYFVVLQNNILNEIEWVLIIIGGILVGFSKERKEDEFIMQTRMDSLLWSVYINFALLLLCILFIYEVYFLFVMIFGMFSILFVFIARFHYVLYKNKKISHGEE